MYWCNADILLIITNSVNEKNGTMKLVMTKKRKSSLMYVIRFALAAADTRRVSPSFPLLRHCSGADEDARAVEFLGITTDYGVLQAAS